MNLRIVAAAVVSATLILGSAGCTLLPQSGGTTFDYQPADGVPGSVGDIEIRNAIGLSENGDDVSLLMLVINTSDSDVTLGVQYTDADGEQVPLTLVVPANSSVQVGTGDEDIVLRNAGATVGGSVDVYFQYGKAPGQQLHIPVLDGSTPEYDGFLPGPAPVETSTATPDPTETPAP